MSAATHVIEFGKTALLALLVVVAASIVSHRIARESRLEPTPAPAIEKSPDANAAATVSFGVGRPGVIIHDARNIAEFGSDLADGWRKDGHIEGRLWLMLPSAMRKSEGTYAVPISVSIEDVPKSESQPPQAGASDDESVSDSACQDGTCGRPRLPRRRR